MGPTDDNRNSRTGAATMREPLVDINTDSLPTEGNKPERKPGRKRLSATPAKSDAPRTTPRTARRRLSEDTLQDGPTEQKRQPPSPPKAHRARLGTAKSQVAVLEPDEATPAPTYDEQTLTNAPPEPTAQPRVRVNPPGFAEVVSELRARQNLPMAIVGGLLAAMVGAMIWAAITVAANFQIGWMAVGVGVLVGGAVRMMGHGLERRYGYLGAVMSIFGCLLGNFLSVCMIVAQQEGLSPGVVLTHINPTTIPDLMIATFHPMDVLFYIIAVCEGYHFSFRKITDSEANRILQAVER